MTEQQTRVCVDCPATFPVKSGPGRPRVRCDACNHKRRLAKRREKAAEARKTSQIPPMIEPEVSPVLNQVLAEEAAETFTDCPVLVTAQEEVEVEPFDMFDPAE